MGFISTFGTATTAPEYHCNTFGTPSWSGTHQDEFTLAQESDLREFIKREALLKGNNDRVQGGIGENQHFFHEEFLGGWPHRLWLEYYRRGIEHLSPPDRLSYDDIWPPMSI